MVLGNLTSVSMQKGLLLTSRCFSTGTSNIEKHPNKCPREARGNIQPLEARQVVECGRKEGFHVIIFFEALVDIEGEVP